MTVLPTSVSIREVGARDGLQGEAPVSVADRVALIEALLAAGVTRLEAVSFVSPRAVPAMAGAAEVLAVVGRPAGVTIAALVPNLRGAQMALEAGVDELTVTASASAAYAEANTHMTIDDSVEVAHSICVAAEGTPVDVVISCAFGSPYEGDIPPADVDALCARLRANGAAAVTLADTTGMATPRRIAELLEVTGSDVGLHLHETRRTGLLNLYAGLLAGVTRFDCGVGGLGGSPFAAGAAGNVATEEAVALLDDLGVATGIDVERMIDAALVLERLVGRSVPSGVAHVGPRGRVR